MKRFFKGFGKNKKNINRNSNINGFEGNNFKKLSPNVSLKRSRFLTLILLLILFSAIVGGMVAKLLDVYVFRDGFIETRNIKIDGDGCDAGVAVAQKAASSVVGLRCVVKKQNSKQDGWSSWFFRDNFKNNDDDDEKDDDGEIIEDDVQSVAVGSAVIVEKDNENLYMVTNFHVVKDTLKGGKNGLIEVHFGADIKKYSAANVLDYDPLLDIAVLKIPLDGVRGKTFSCASIGNSDELRQGEQVYCLGSPIGMSYNQSMSHGIVSDMIQTDAAMNPGNSGGGLYDKRGELIGINRAKVGNKAVNFGRVETTVSEGMSLSIPINDVKGIISNMIRSRSGKVVEKLPTLGIIMLDEREAMFYPLVFNFDGVFVKDVMPGSAADKAGIEAGDVIIEFDGKKVKNAKDLDNMLSNKRDKTARVTIIRASRRNKAFKKKEVEVVFDV